MPTRVVIVGAGGLGREVLQVLRDQRRAGADIDCHGFLVDPEFARTDRVNGLPVYTDANTMLTDDSIRFIIAVGNPADRARIADRIERRAGPRFATVVHPSAIVADTATIGLGSILLPACSVSVDVTIGQHVLVNPQASIAHDCVIGDYVSLAPAVTLAGGVHLEQGCELGSAATVIPRLRVGEWAVVGAGAVVIRPVAPSTTVAGVPAREIRHSS